MKTLDEVIEIASDLTNGFDERSIEKQMLHYLKEYKYDKNDLTAIRTYLALQNDNPALTWDELRQMKNKPVWIETYLMENRNAWYLICGIDDNFMLVADAYGGQHNFPRVCLDSDMCHAYKSET